MPDSTTTRLYPKATSLAKLQVAIRSDESAGLELQALGHTDIKSAVTYLPADLVPTPPVRLIDITNAPPTVPVGSTKVCEGYVWNANGPAHVLAVR